MKNNSKNTSNYKNKKAIVMNQTKRKAFRFKPIETAVAIVIFVVVATIAYTVWSKNGNPGKFDLPSYEKAQVIENDQIIHPVHVFDDGKARHFEFRTQGITIRYFIIKSADGVIRAAFDACDVCWRSGKGYTQDGDFMVCGNCGRRFASNLVNEVQGGCNPAPLHRSVQGDKLIIKMDDISQGQSYFNI